MKLRRLLLLAPMMTALLGGIAACEGCRTGTQATHPGPGGEPASPTLRLYVVSDLAGALEPCGCVKDQLGGLDHFAAWLDAERAKAPASAVIAAGPLFFMDPVLKDERKAQDLAKAKTMAAALGRMGLVAFAPGKNDWAAGTEALEDLRRTSGAALLAGNVTDPKAPPSWKEPVVREIGGIKLGLIGVAAPDKALGGAPDSLVVAPAVDVVRAGEAKLRAQGAQAIVVLAAVGRGEAKRIADAVPDVAAIVVGSPGGEGDANSETPPAERVGNVLIAETGNHLTTAAAIDLYVREGSFAFADGSGLARAEKRAELSRRIDDLRGKIAQWESASSLWGDGGKAPSADIEARKADLVRLEAERAKLDVEPAPTTGSFFRYRVQEVRDRLGKDPKVVADIDAYYKEVNDHNRQAFADRVPRPAPAGQPSYLGVEECTSCHDDAREVWDKTPHAHAYVTLQKTHKEFNLDCVSCHVTGYDAPGGSTVTHVAKLEGVQCETCHGPGSLHAKSPNKVKMPIPKPQPKQCLDCHHPPHVHEFDAKAKIDEILGPGHGKPAD